MISRVRRICLALLGIAMEAKFDIMNEANERLFHAFEGTSIVSNVHLVDEANEKSNIDVLI